MEIDNTTIKFYYQSDSLIQRLNLHCSLSNFSHFDMVGKRCHKNLKKHEPTSKRLQDLDVHGNKKINQKIKKSKSPLHMHTLYACRRNTYLLHLGLIREGFVDFLFFLQLKVLPQLLLSNLKNIR